MKDLLFADEYSIELKYLVHVVSNSIFHSKFKQIKFLLTMFSVNYLFQCVFKKVSLRFSFTSFLLFSFYQTFSV